MTRLRIAFIALFVVALGATPTQAQQEWSFSGVDSIDLDGVSGDVVVRQGQGSEILIVLDESVRPADAFRGTAEQRGSTVFVEEDWGGGNSRGSVEWTLVIPASMEPEIRIDTASGRLEASGVQARFEFDSASGYIRLDDMTLLEGSSFDTASGDIALTDVVIGDDVDFDTASGDIVLTDVVIGDDVNFDTASGDVEITGVRTGAGFDASTASGNVRIERSEGVLRGSSASGNVHVIETALTGPSKFSSASGDVTVRLTALPEYELEASSASGDVRFDAAFGNDFTLVMTKREDRGRINSPFEPTSEETFRRNNRQYVRQTVERGSGGPEIRLSTASGSIEVRNRR